MRRMYEVLVGNIGTVYHGTSHRDAWICAQEYRAQSQAGCGRTAGEPVTILADGEPIDEYAGSQPAEDDAHE